MDIKLALEAFAQRYVVVGFRERFVHEATKRPAKLHARICHNIGDVLPPSLAGGTPAFTRQDRCLALDGPRAFRSTTWGELQRKIGLGEGLLVVGLGGSRFYAETEAVKGGPSVVYGHGG